MPLLPRDIRRFCLEDDPENAKGIRGQLVEIVQRSSFTIEYLHEPNPYATPAERRRGDVFAMYLKPQATARRLYGLDREILLWCSTYASFQARDIDALYTLMDETGTRLSRQFAVLVTTYERSARNLLESEGERDQSLVHVSMAEMRRDGLDALLARHLYSRDLFDVTGATLRSADFFGRRELIDRLVSEVETGTSQIGVFGLRKVGKTSLLNRVADKLRNSGKVTVARLDLQWTTSINDHPEYTLWAMGESIYASHRSIRSVKQLRLFGQFSTFSDISDPSGVWEWFAHDIHELSVKSRRRVCILVDEIERMYETPGDRGFVRFWRLLRGLDQQNPGTLRFIVGGTSPQCAESGSILGDDNPLFNYLQLEYLGPLSDEDAGRLLTTLGGTMGLWFDPSAVSWVLQQCGGHPALLRALGSAVHRDHLGRTAPARISSSNIVSAEPALRQRAAPILDQMLAALRDQYPTEYELLEFLAKGQVYQFREYSAVMPSEERRLSNYGLITIKPGPMIAIRQLHAHMLRDAERARRVTSHQATLSPGEPIGEWQVIECLASGGYADVYKVASGQDVAAAKVLRHGQLSALQREVDILSQLDHPGVVDFRGSLRADDGSPCLIMEFLEGATAAAHCAPNTAPPTETLVKWLLQLLDTLSAIHPRLDVARELESHESLDSASFAEWGKARHGYVHRDIKPENIMIVPGRGPVLIDFNISVRAGAPVVTTSASAGYLPALPVRWGPECDLHALGLTALELGAGLRMSNCSVDELSAMVRDRHGEAILGIINELLTSADSGVSAGAVRSRATRLRRQ